MDNIDVIFYINLESRTDRKEHFLNEIQKLCTDPSKVIRIDAVRGSNDSVGGAIGCTKSHILALEQFKSNPLWNTCMVFEDDFTFYDTSLKNNNESIQTFFSNFTDWGMLLLASRQTKPSTKTHIGSVELVSCSYTTSGYCINKNFLEEILENYKQSAQLLDTTGIRNFYAIDVYWNNLSIKRYAFVQNMGYQYNTYSDIEMKNVNYNC